MKTVKKWFADPKVRLAARAILAGVAVAFTHLKGGNLTHGAIEGALVAGAWTAIELFTPLNGVIGVFKQIETIDPALKKYGPPAKPAA